MDQTKVYVQGKPGFKAAVQTKLGGTWIHGSHDLDIDTVMFSLGEDSELSEFKSSVGKELTNKYELQFFTDLPKLNEMTLVKGEKTGGSVTMSIWAGSDSKLVIRK